MKSNPVVIFVSVALAFGIGCSRRPAVPDVGSKTYGELCSAFYLGLAALESGEDVNARKGLTRATELAPDEPAAWVDLGLLELRQQEYDAAYRDFEKARTLSPEDSRIETFLGLTESKRGKVAATLAHYRRAVALDGSNLRALYSLAGETERQQSAGSDSEALKLLNQILDQRPHNAPVLLDVIRLRAKQNDAAGLKTAVEMLSANAGAWPEPARTQLVRLRDAAAKTDFRTAAISTQFLRNTLVRELGYRRSLDEIKAPSTTAGEPFTKFVRLPSPTSEPSAPDMQLQFTAQPAAPGSASAVNWIGSIVLDGEGRTELVWADAALHIGAGTTLPLPSNSRLGIHAVLGADLNYDFLTDLVIATPAGVRLYRQDNARRFNEVTSTAKLPAAVLNRAYTGAWATDIDLDGDLDVVLGVPQGDPVVLRNNGDGTFAVLHPFAGVNGTTDFATADFNVDGVPDAAILDANGKLHIFTNERLGSYKPRPVPSSVVEGNIAVTTGDVNGDGIIDCIALRRDSTIVRLSDKDYGRGWDTAELGRTSGQPANVMLADLDNNGALDIVAGAEVFLSNGKQFTPLPAHLPADAWAIEDLNADGRLDVIGLNTGHRPVQLISRGAKNYNWQVIRPRAATVMGDQRINSFGVGGEIEIRSGLLTQKQTIRCPSLHFGLGERSGVEFARIVWPNGLIQAEFNLKPQQSVLAQQRLKGSCPFLFTWDGSQMRFLKDVGPMSAPLGAHLDGRTLEPLHQTEQWFKIGGDELAPRDGYYDLRLTNEYWETYYIDHYSLMVIDHPPEAHVFVDERVADPPAPLKLYVTAEPRPFASATDESGRDVRQVVSARDETYLEGFGTGQYQGLARDHWVELELPADAPRSGSVYLLADGFIHPWDDTVTIARSQNRNVRPEPLHIEVLDAQGRWTAVENNVGIPAGRLKTVVLDISTFFKSGAPRRLRLRTNLEVYWDKLAWAPGRPDTRVKIQRAALSEAELRYRGFSLITQAGPIAPELAHYNNLVRTTPQWRSLEGYYTRYGDVRELLDRVDDRLVIAGSGDELRMKFAEAPPVAGWKRDFIFVGDGWLKEGDYNFQFSKTVLPLPYHGLKNYDLPLTPLEENRAYRLHPSDWQQFHTRYVTDEPFTRALWQRLR